VCGGEGGGEREILCFCVRETLSVVAAYRCMCVCVRVCVKSNARERYTSKKEKEW